MTLSWRITIGPINHRTYTQKVVSHQLENWPHHRVSPLGLRSLHMGHTLSICYINKIFYGAEPSITKGSLVGIVNKLAASTVIILGTSSWFSLQMCLHCFPQILLVCRGRKTQSSSHSLKECPQYRTHGSLHTTHLHTVTRCWLMEAERSKTGNMGVYSGCKDTKIY